MPLTFQYRQRQLSPAKLSPSNQTMNGRSGRQLETHRHQTTATPGLMASFALMMVLDTTLG